MKVINFSCVEALPELLKFFETEGKSGKDQTIRPLRKDGKPHFDIGEKITVYWKQRTSPKGSYFWRHNGKRIEVKDKRANLNHNRFCFPKIMGIVKVSEVFEVDFTKVNLKDGKNYQIRIFEKDGVTLTLSNWALGKKIAKRDGFTSSKQFFKWFDSNYDLSKPKPFQVIRYEFVSSKIK